MTTRPVPTAALAALALLALATAPAAQMGLLPDENVPYPLDTGSVVNSSKQLAVVASFGVQVETARHLRLYFDEIKLAGSVEDGTGSFLQVTSLFDGEMQRLDAVSAAQWQNSTAYFNGDAVQVELLAWPGTGENRLVLTSVDAQPPQPPQLSQCGPVDDRVLSFDPRVVRVMPVLCTGWMIDDCAHCFLTAGHCVGTITSVQFNPPLSTGGGSPVNSPIADQYPIDGGSIQATNGGLGNDWAYFGTFPNSNTGLTAFEAQGDAFVLANPPGSPSGNTIRITGHGSDSTPLQNNYVQQTHTGPMTQTGSVLQYQVDTTGGSSGSPVIWEDTGEAIGIHTNGGCSTGGGGANSASAITNSGLQAALENPTGVCLEGAGSANFADLGGGLTSFPFPNPPTLTGCGSLESDSIVRLTVSTAPYPSSTLTSTLVLGVSALNAPFKGGTLVPSPDVLIPGLPIDPNNGYALTISFTWPAGVPSGTSLYWQHWINVTGLIGDFLIASNGLQMTQP